MTRLALLRHYPTDWNREGRLQGQSDIPLTGEAEEMLAGLALPPPWDRARIVASSLSRAWRTAELLAAGPVERDARLAEISFGDWEGRLAEELAADPTAYFRPTHLWEDGDSAPGGETLAAAWPRARAALSALAGRGDAVVVTHKAMMRLILRRAGVPDPEIKRGRLYPLTISSDGMPSDPGEPVRLVPR